MFISNNNGATLGKHFKENFCVMKNIEKEFKLTQIIYFYLSRHVQRHNTRNLILHMMYHGILSIYYTREFILLPLPQKYVDFMYISVQEANYKLLGCHVVLWMPVKLMMSETSVEGNVFSL